MSFRKTRCLPALLAFVASSAITRAAAFTYSPDFASNDLWSSGVGWSAIPVSAAATTLNFSDNSLTFPNGFFTNSSQNNFAGNFTLNALNLAGKSPEFDPVTIALTGNPLQFQNNGLASPMISLDALALTSALNYKITTDFILNNNLTVQGNGTANFSFNGSISGPGALSKTGNSAVTLTGSNSFTGGVILTAGTIVINADSGLGAVPASPATNLTFNGGALRITADFSTAVTRNILLSGAATFDTTTHNLSILGSVTGSGPFNKLGAGTLSLFGNNNAGPTTISQGTLAVSLATLGSVNIASGATLSLTPGLLGKYYDFVPTEADMPNLATFNATLGAHAANHFFDLNTSATGPNLDFGSSGANFPGKYAAGPSNFEVQFSGKINITTAGNYTFDTGSDDGSMLFIDGNTVVNNNFMQGLTVRSNTIPLTAGLHDIVLGYYQGGGGYVFFADYNGPDTGNSTIRIPNAVLASGSTTIGSLTGAGNVTLNANGLIIGSDNTSPATFTGSISGPGSITKIGSGTLAFANTNTYLGGTTLASGTVAINSDNTLGTAPASPATNITFTGGTLQPTADFSLAQTRNVLISTSATFDTNNHNLALLGNISGGGSLTKTGAGTLALARATSTGTINILQGTLSVASATLGAVSISSGTTFSLSVSTGLLGKYYDFVPTEADMPDLSTFNATLAAHAANHSFDMNTGAAGPTLDFDSNGATFPGKYAVNPVNFEAQYSGKINIITAGNYTFDTGSDDGSMLFIDGNTVVNNNFMQGLTVRSNTILLTAGLHDIVLGYYQGGGGYGFFADYKGPDTGNSTIRIPNAVLSPGNTTIGSLTGAGNVNLNSNFLVIGADNASPAPFTGSIFGAGSIVKIGSGILTFAGTNSYSGNTTVSAGLFLLTSSTSLPSGNNLSIAAGASVKASGSSTLLKLSSLTLAPALPGGWSSAFDLADAKLIVEDSIHHNGTLASLIGQAIYGKTHNTGIFSSTKLATQSLVVVDNAIAGKTTFAGQPVNSSDILLLTTYTGDANLDGQVTIADLNTLASHWQQKVSDWSQGDFNGDGQVTIADLNSIAANWQAGVGAGANTESFFEALTSIPAFGATAPIPEPASLALCSFLSLPLIVRKRTN